MSRILKIFALLVLALGVSTLTQAGDFQGTTDSFQLSPDTQAPAPTLEFAKAMKPKPSMDEASTTAP